jgi:hypothetical protein
MLHIRMSSIVAIVAAILLIAPATRADAVVDWNVKACEIAGPASFDTPTANRMLAVMHTAIYEAVNSITRKYPAGAVRIDSPAGASIDAAVAAAGRATLLKFAPTRSAEIDAAYRSALRPIPDGKAKTDGINIGEQAAAAVITVRTFDLTAPSEVYRPYTIAGVYVPTVVPLVSSWSERKPWMMTSPSQFRPGPPPKLTSELWARDYNEIKSLGRRDGSKRTAEQTDIARFWEATGPSIYHGILASLGNTANRDVTQNARLYMVVTQAIDDAMIAIFDAKYHYNFWRPITAIRNGDIDGNDATERDPSWTPFINTPMHPEYPCAHCIVSGTVGTILQAEIGNSAAIELWTNSPTANNAKRTWIKLDDFMQEVANGRIYDGVHFRNSTEVGTAMGREIGKLFAVKYLGKAKQ